MLTFGYAAVVRDRWPPAPRGLSEPGDPGSRAAWQRGDELLQVLTVGGGVTGALIGAMRLVSVWCLSVGVEQGAFGRALGEVRKSVVSDLSCATWSGIFGV